MKKELVKELLNRNPKMLKALHDLYDFDFMEEYEIKKINGRFTLNNIKKTLGLPELYGYTTAVIITNVKYNERYNYIVKVVDSGFCISWERRVYGSVYDVDYFFSKGSFEDARKEEKTIVYVICQKADLTKKASEKKPDLNERFIFKYVTRWGDGRGKHGISQIDVLDKMHNNKKFTYKTRRPESSENVNYFLDKSGYLVEEKKEDLKRKALKLRTEREKAAADAADFSKEVKEYFERVEELKKNIIERLINATNFDSICEVDKMVSALRWLQLSIDRFKECNENKGFSSIASAKNRMEDIIKEFEKIETMISPV